MRSESPRQPGLVDRKVSCWLPRLAPVVILLYALVARPWQLRWGATAEEASTPLRGDDLVPDASYVTTRAITVRAPAGAIWPWLVQLGQGRAGFYTYDQLEQIVGAAIRSAERIVPELRQPALGDVRLSPVGGPTVAVLDPGRALVLYETMDLRTVSRSRLCRPHSGRWIGPGRSRCGRCA